MKNLKYTRTMEYLAEKYNFEQPQELPRFTRENLVGMYDQIQQQNVNLMSTTREDYQFCPTCKGLGFVIADQHSALCPERCGASHQLQRDYLQRMSHNMHSNTDPLDTEQSMSLKQYKQGATNEHRIIALGIANELVKHHRVEHRGITKNSLMFFGETGTGKTALSSAIVNDFKQRGYVAFFIRVDDLMAAIRSTYNKDDKPPFSTEQMIRFFARAEILAIDEFDLEHISDHDRQMIERIINHRCDKQLITIMTTNSTQDEFKQRWGLRIHSRVLHMAHWILINGVIRNQNKPLGADHG